MSDTAGAATPTAAPAAAVQPPQFRWMSIVPTLVFDALLPVVIFNVLSAYHVPTLYALTAGGISPLLNNLRSWVKTRRLEPIGILVLTFLVLGAVTSLISGNVFFALIKDSFLTGTVGLIFLGSLLRDRPLLFYVLRQFVAGEDPERIAWWNGLWVHPEVRQGTRVVTAVWGIVYLIEAGTRVAMALTLTPAQVVSISPIMGIGATVLLIVFTRRYMEQMRRRREARMAAGG